jgi:hypothetical protein
MGQRRTGDGALGPAAVRCLAPLAAFLLTGCSSIGAVSGAAVGLATGGATSNPLVGYAAGVGTQAAVDDLVKYISRKRQQGEQDEIALVVGKLEPGQSAPWKIEHDIPIGNEHGDVMLAAVTDNALTSCREVVFTVIDGDAADAPRGRFVTTACAQGKTWKWAQAEPATARWGYLQ